MNGGRGIDRIRFGHGKENDKVGIWGLGGGWLAELDLDLGRKMTKLEFGGEGWVGGFIENIV